LLATHLPWLFRCDCRQFFPFSPFPGRSPITFWGLPGCGRTGRVHNPMVFLVSAFRPPPGLNPDSPWTFCFRKFEGISHCLASFPPIPREDIFFFFCSILPWARHDDPAPTPPPPLWPLWPLCAPGLFRVMVPGEDFWVRWWPHDFAPVFKPPPQTPIPILG